MKFSKGSVITTVIIIVLVLIIIGGGVWYFIANKPKACTQEAKVCPDGTYVSRTGKNCEFAECPIADNQFKDWKTYKNEEYGFEAKYPTAYDLSNCYRIGPKDLLACTSIEKGNNSLSIEVFSSMPYGFNQKPSLAETESDDGKEVLVDGKKVIVYTAEYPKGQLHKYIYLSNNGKFYYLTASVEKGSENEFNQILSTFKFIE